MFDRLVGISLKHKHINQISEENSNAACLNIGWFEVHSENYLTLGGLGFDKLLEIRKNYQISLHGIGMSLGSSDGLDINYLNQIKNLIDAVDPFLVSDHLSWSSISDHFLPELLPTPFNDEALKIFADNISFAQEKLGRQILVENPSTYYEFTNSTYPEPEFLNILAKNTGAGVILDINNV